MKKSAGPRWAVLCMAALIGAAAAPAHAEISASTTDPTTRTLQPAGSIEAQAPRPEPIRGLEFYGSRNHLTDDNPSWHEFGLRGLYGMGDHLLQGELVNMRRWNENGIYAAIGDTYTFNPDWYGSLTVGAGDGASYLPRYRTDGFINRKLLARKNLVGTLGAGYYRAPDGHIDRNVNIGATYYFQLPLVVQGEVRFTHGSPGGVDTRQQFIAGTWGREKHTTFTGRYGWGEEGYQAIGDSRVLTNFRSKELSFNMRHWLGRDWGLEAALDHYRNPHYRRNGVVAGLFWLTP